MCVCVCVYVCICVYARVSVYQSGRLSYIYVLLTEYDPYLKLTLDLSRWQVSRVKQGTVTLREHLVPHPLQVLYCIGCPRA